MRDVLLLPLVEVATDPAAQVQHALIAPAPHGLFDQERLDEVVHPLDEDGLVLRSRRLIILVPLYVEHFLVD